jgi:GT2 family glycosyltransferase
MAEVIRLVCATRLSHAAFMAQSALGQSLQRFAFDADRLKLSLCVDNTHGLPDIYNDHIARGAADEVIAFIHDDVWLDDSFFADRLLQGLEQFDVIGVAGNTRRAPHQSAWAFSALPALLNATTERPAMDFPHLSGSIGHGDNACGRISRFGASSLACELLDGVLLAARKSTLRSAGVQFDARFDFHFYDMDFCRSARARGLRLGTWPISLTHQSRGGYDSAAWQAARELYFAKWTN